MKQSFFRHYFFARGFTLIEVILYVTLLGIFMMTIFTVLSATLQARVKHQTISEVNGQGQFALAAMIRAVRNARKVVSPAPGTTSTLLSLVVDDAVKNPTVFDLSNGTIRMTEGAGAPVALVSYRLGTTELVFTNAGVKPVPTAVKIQFRIDAVNAGAANAYSYPKIFYGAASLR